jgi:cell division protein FtsW
VAKKLAFDRALFTTVVVLLAFGLTMVFSASAAATVETRAGVSPFLLRQSAAAALGLVAMWLVMHVDYRVLRRPVVLYSGLGAVTLLLVAVLFQPAVNGSRRWLFLGPASFQPSELAKVALIVFAAYQIERQGERQRWWELVAPCGAVALLFAALIMLEPDMGTAMLLAAAGLLMLFLAGSPLRFFAVSAGILVPIAFVLVRLEPYRWRRMIAFLDPERYALDAGFQASQSLIAVGSGGLFGLGLGNSVQKLHFLPHPQSDFIFSIVGEELGLAGALALLALFGVLLWRGVVAGLRAPDVFGRYLAWGLVGMMGLQAVLHVSVALSLIPTTGVPLPFLSAGGSALLATLLACGVLLNVSQHS